MEGDIFDWKPFLGTNNFEAACVSSIKHAPGAQIWSDYVTIGLKVLIRHQDIPPNPSRRKHAFWVATIVQIKGYFCKIRYEGMENDSSADFWIHIGKHDVYPVGAGLKNMVLIPPKSVVGRVQDWRNHFISKLPGVPTLPDDFALFMKKAVTGSKYKVGEHLEVIDKYKISQLRVARVSKIIGRRMYLRYLDDYEDGFVCHELSSVIHTLGWAACVGHKLKAPPNFSSVPESATSPRTCNSEETLKEGMRLEAVDPLCPARIGAATICKILEFGYMMIKMDCYESKPSDDDWFCYNIKSPYIFECGFCESNGITLVPPYGLTSQNFTWAQYFDENNCVPAPIPKKTSSALGFTIGMKLEMVDVMTPTKIHIATIVQIAGNLLRINFDGWEPEFDQWLDAESPDIFPIGWCALVGHKLDGPQIKTEFTE